MAPRPQLVRFGALRLAHFEASPVWVGCHGLDDDEEWYDDTDEETFRAWTKGLPVDPTRGMYLVRTTVTLHDGTELPGFITPQPAGAPTDMGILQPQIWLPDGTLFGFWSGMVGCPPSAKARFYEALKKAPDGVFPASFAAHAGLTLGRASGVIEGFCSSPDLETVTVET